ncbi:MAG: hypothetical protein JSW70_01790, partial [Syntrophobacterales bacterium]
MKRLLVFALALVFVGALAVPAIAGEVTVGGNVRMVTAWINQSEDFSITGESRTDAHFETALVGSFFQIKYVNEDVSALIDIALPYTAGAQSPSILRQGYGTWTFAEGSELLLGQTFCIFAPACAVGQILRNDTVCTGYGSIWQDWRPQVRYTRTMEFGSLRVAAVKPNQQTFVGFAGTPYAIIPRLEAAADFKVADVTITPSFVFNTFGIEEVTVGQDETYTTYGGALGVSWALAAVKITAEAYYGQNLFIFTGPDSTPV